MNSKFCEKCIHWKITSQYQGECRRNPPVITSRGVEWPVTKDINYCGEFDSGEVNEDALVNAIYDLITTIKNTSETKPKTIKKKKLIPVDPDYVNPKNK